MKGEVAAVGLVEVQKAPADVVLVSERLSPCPEATYYTAGPDFEFNSTGRPST